MPRPRISMRKTKEILRLALKEGLPQRQIAESVGASKTSVQDILVKAKQLELDWASIKDLHEPDIVARLFPRAPGSSTKVEPAWSSVDQELRKKGNTLALLWLDYKQDHPDGMGYSSFCEYYKKWKKNCGLTMRQHHPAGKKMFVDFSGLKVPWLDLETGEIREAEIFVAVLGASSYTFARAVNDQSSQSWLDCHVRAFEFFKGVPEVVVPDNLKAGVSRACRYDPDTNPAYLLLAEHYGTAIIPARAYKPRDKSKVEVGVQVVQRWILAILRRQTFASILDINLCIQPHLERLNNKVMKHLSASRRSLFEGIEFSALKPLPNDRFSVPTWKLAKVNIDYHIEFDKHYYSVPYRFVGKSVDIKAVSDTLEVFEGGKRIALHPRVYSQPGRHTTQSDHMPRAHKAHADWTPERVIKWAEESGPFVADFCQRILKSKAHPEQGFRSCLGILRLGKEHGYDRLEKACEMAIAMKSLRYRTIHEILKSESDRKVRILKPVKITQIEHHENIRGADYYS